MSDIRKIMSDVSCRLSPRDSPSLYERHTVSGGETVAETRHRIFSAGSFVCRTRSFITVVSSEKGIRLEMGLKRQEMGLNGLEMGLKRLKMSGKMPM